VKTLNLPKIVSEIHWAKIGFKQLTNIFQNTTNIKLFPLATLEEKKANNNKIHAGSINLVI
jgi:hypothetical protein